MAQDAISAVKEAEKRADAIEREGALEADRLVEDALQAAQARKEEISRNAEAEAQRLSAGLAEQAAARRGDAIDAVKRLLFA